MEPRTADNGEVRQKIAKAAAAAILAVYVAGYTRTSAVPPAPRIQTNQAATQSKARWKEGDWQGRGHCPHGDIIATVSIKNGRIRSTVISQCMTRYSCDVLEELLPQTAQRQSPEIDFVSGATESTDAFYEALTQALSRASL